MLAAAAAGVRSIDRGRAVAFLVGAVAFTVLYWSPITTLGRDWWNDADASHGLLLAPLAVYLAWKRGRVPGARAQPLLGLLLLTAAVVLRYLSGLAAELFTMRLSLMGAVGALVVLGFGVRQLLHWWLPCGLLLLSIPVPAILTNTLAFPLQLKASQLGAAMLESRHVPVHLAGNVIHLPDRALFVTEACSGLRSLTALIALGLLIGGIWLRRAWTRVLLIAVAIPVAMMLNGVRIFLTGFLVHFVDPQLGDGVMHYTEGWALFVAAFAILGGLAWLMVQAENTVRLRRSPAL